MKIVKLNVDEERQWAGKFGVMSIPTIMLFRNGQAAGQIIGAVPKAEIVRQFSLS
ncbi:MAG TPA: thioredoxin domain-containing protein [Anaerolineae bacterium]|nr:thioredoxin domain-containing protein [Anaerolineae bacterium]